MSKFDLGKMEVSGATGIDALFDGSPEIVSPHRSGRRRVASLADLNGFVRVASDTLVHQSRNELWSLQKDGDKYYISRLFDDGKPLR